MLIGRRFTAWMRIGCSAPTTCCGPSRNRRGELARAVLACGVEVAAQSSEAKRPVLVHSCRHLGRTANPPSFWLLFTDWHRHGRRR